MKFPLRLYEYHFDFPDKTEPKWSSRVDRWYQLDAAAYGLAELAYRIPTTLPIPNALFVASPGASNESDFRFSLEGAHSAQKFAHTLPNVRVSPFLQIREWKGPVLCIQKDPCSLVTAIQQADIVYPRQNVWILSSAFEGRHVARLITLDLTQGINSAFSIAGVPLSALNSTDKEVVSLLKESNFEQVI